MPIPDTPYTRKEAYLNAIATGDSGGIPETPYTREEMYLDAIARGGGGGGGGSSTLSGLTDVDISNPADGQTLVYNSTSGKWENGAGGGGSGGGVFIVTYTLTGTSSEDGGTATCDHTAAEIGAAVDAGKYAVACVRTPYDVYYLPLTERYVVINFWFEFNEVAIPAGSANTIWIVNSWLDHYVDDDVDVIEFDIAHIHHVLVDTNA